MEEVLILKHIVFLAIPILYLIFSVIQLNTIHDNEIMNNKKVLVGLVGENGANIVNSVANNQYLKEYQRKLYEEANFDDTKKYSTGKEGFKRPYLFFLFLKDCFFFAFKVVSILILIIFCKLLIDTLRNPKKDKDMAKVAADQPVKQSIHDKIKKLVNKFINNPVVKKLIVIQQQPVEIIYTTPKKQFNIRDFFLFKIIIKTWNMIFVVLKFIAFIFSLIGYFLKYLKRRVKEAIEPF